MSDSPTSRRQALRRAGLTAAALAGASIARPPAALAQSSDDEDLRDFLVAAIALEQLTVLAYATAARQAGAGAELERFRDQEQAHASALRSALDSLVFDAPDAPSSPADTDVFDGVEGLDNDQASELKRLLGELEDLGGTGQALRLLDELEQRQLELYLDQGPGLDSEDLATTAAEIAGCQAQHRVVLRERLGAAPAVAVSAGGGGASASSAGAGGAPSE